MNNKIKNIRQLKSQGYAIISGNYVFYIKKKLRQEILRLCNFILKRHKKKNNFNNLEKVTRFMLKVDKFYNKKTLAELYDLIPTLPCFHNLASEKKILKIVKDIGLNFPSIGTNPSIRIDRPFDKKFNTLVHQDFWYSFVSKNSLTIWFTINENSLENIGNLKIADKFDSKKIIKFKKGNLQTFSASQRHTRFLTFKEIRLKKNEILIFNQLLPHKSGKNMSNYPRISVQLRYNDLYKAKSLRSSFKCVNTDYVKNMQNFFFLN